MCFEARQRPPECERNVPVVELFAAAQPASVYHSIRTARVGLPARRPRAEPAAASGGTFSILLGQSRISGLSQRGAKPIYPATFLA